MANRRLDARMVDSSTGYKGQQGETTRYLLESAAKADIWSSVFRQDGPRPGCVLSRLALFKRLIVLW